MNKGQEKIIKILGLVVLCLLMSIMILGITGCANIADMKTAKIESEYRKQLLNTTNRPAPGYDGPIEMPKEWMDQWPSLREDGLVDKSSE